MTPTELLVPGETLPWVVTRVYGNESGHFPAGNLTSGVNFTSAEMLALTGQYMGGSCAAYLLLT